MITIYEELASCIRGELDDLDRVVTRVEKGWSQLQIELKAFATFLDMLTQ